MTEKAEVVSMALDFLGTLSEILRRSDLNIRKVFTLKISSTV